MEHGKASAIAPAKPDTGLASLFAVASYYKVPGDPATLVRELGLAGRACDADDVVRGARMLGLKARRTDSLGERRLRSLPLPAILDMGHSTFAIAGSKAEGKDGIERLRVIDPVAKTYDDLTPGEVLSRGAIAAVLVARRFRGEGKEPEPFGLSWFLPSIWRYRRPLSHVLVASLFIQLLALATPLFFQIVVDKVLAHKSYSTLYVLAAGLLAVGLFDSVMQYLRTYMLSHTTNRIDVELGRRLFAHLLQLPISYFETRAAGQTVARLRELETVRTFLTGQAMFSALDLAFAFVFVAVLFAYSTKLTLIVLCSVPFYLFLGLVVRPVLRSRVKERFDKGASSQQFLVEAVVGMQTVKSAAVEPLMRTMWEERLAAYVRSGFEATLLGAAGQQAVQYVSKSTNALILLFGAFAVMDGQLSVGSLVAFNMLAAQAIQPILRLSQLWQDFQQVQVSVERLGDVLNAPVERSPTTVSGALGRPKGAIALERASFRYRPNERDVLRNVTLSIAPGEVVGIVGPSGSGKSTLTKLVQRLHAPSSGRVTIDGADVAQLDPSWLRSQVGVVLQDSVLFNRSVHDNIALANPSMPRSHVVAVAKLTGADEFVSRMPHGYDTIIEERGSNLSGGQRQRLAIARALATNPPVLILDEATSALDYESERLIRANMARIAKGRTVIVVAHRLAAVRRCDRIVGLVDGEIVEQGTHDQLMARKGLYARLWAMQSDDEEEAA